MAEVTITQALSRRRTVREFTGASISLAALERLIWAAQGATDDSGKRTAPSAHAMHPLRLFVVANHVEGLDRGLYGIDPVDLAMKPLVSSDLRAALRKTSIGDPQWVTDAACIVAFCADMVAPSQAFADQKPYGLRGPRYVYLEVGAAAQNLQLQAVSEELGSVWVGGFNDEATAEILGLQAPLTPIILMCVGYAGSDG